MELSVMERDVPEGGPCGGGLLHSKPSSRISTSPQIRRPVRQKMKASNTTEDQEESLLPSHDDLSKCDIGDEATSISFPVPEDATAKAKDKRKRASKAPMTYKKRRKVKGLAVKGKSSSSHQMPRTMNPVIAASATSSGLDPMDITDTVDTPGEHPTAPTDEQPKKSRGPRTSGRGKQMGQKLNLAFRELVDEDSASIPDGPMASENNDQPDNTFEPPSKPSPTGSVFRGYSQLMSSSDYAAVQLATDHEAPPRAFQQQSTSFQTNGSQEPFFTAYTDHFMPRSESTSESQRPLLATQSSAEETGLGPTNHRSMPKKSIVDQNGSPRLLPQKNMYLGPDPEMIDSASPAGQIRPPSNEAETTGAWGNLPSSQSTQLMCTFHREISLNYYPLDCGKKGIPKRLTEGTLFGPPLYLKWSPNASRPVRNDGNHVEPEKAPALAPEPMTPVPNYRREHAATMSASSLPQQESSPYDQMIEWMASFQEAQRAVTELMLETNEDITHQLEEEREAIAFVLDEYHEESLWALDRLFQARTTLYRESVAAMLQQQADLCMRLVWRLQGGRVMYPNTFPAL